MPKILILGGTTEASALAARIHAAGIPAILSYAGRVENPRVQPIPTRVGGFGGASGLADHLRANDISHIVDATHPFAARISANAITAAQMAHVPLMALQRPPWIAQVGDRWHDVSDGGAAVAWLENAAPARVFLAIGRQSLGDFAHLDRHAFLLRLVDPPQDPLGFRDATVVVDRGPFTLAGDRALIHDHNIDVLVAKNAGGRGAEAKITAARDAGVQIVMIARPYIPPRPICISVDAVMAWIHDHLGV